MPRFEIVPVAKPRMTQSDKWNNRPAVVRYWTFKDELQLEARRQGFILPSSYSVTFFIPMPQGWSQKKKKEMIGSPHRQKPDLDNLVKAINDALCPDDDAGIWETYAKKVWDIKGAIEIWIP